MFPENEMNEIQKKIVQRLIIKADDLMRYFETPEKVDLKVAHQMFDDFLTDMERHKETHHSIREALANFRVQRGSNPDDSDWHSYLYDAHFTLGYWLDHYKD